MPGPRRLARRDRLYPAKLLEQRHHLHVVRIGRRVLAVDLLVLLRRLEHERNAARSLVLQQGAKRLDANVPVADQRVTILVRAEWVGAVVQMEKAGRLARRVLEFIERVL